MGFVWSNRQPVRLGEFSSEPLPTGSDVTVERDSARSIARVLRPEVKRASLLIETSRLDSSLASEFMRPFVELNAGLISYDVSSPTSVDYKVGLNISQPLLFRQASAQLQTSTIAVDRAEISRDLVQRIVEIDAENASIAVSRAKERLSFANGEVETARVMVLAEQSKFLAGDSSLLLINLRERFLAEALQRLVTAKADVARALVALAWATGVI
jgi:outer membrane protein TolC